MEKMKMETPNLTNQNIEKIAELFPNCVTEGKDENGQLKKLINFDMLKQMLSDSLTEGKEVYEFTWPGKKEAIIEANTPIRKTLRPCKEESKNWDTTENLYIEGDNLEVLKLLQESYLGKVKMIYIDPPYNTGNDFIYDDSFRAEKDEYETIEGSLSEDGIRMIKNTESNGRFHSDWCSMIYPRLLLAKNLLADDGVIFISIDDNEQNNLVQICNEIFGASNCIGPIIQNKQNAKNDTLNIQKNHEYILVYRKSVGTNKGSVLPTLQKKSKVYKDVFEENGRYFYIKDAITTRGEGGTLNARPNLGYSVYFNPQTKDKIAVLDYDVALAKTSNDENKVYSSDSSLLSKGYVAIRPPKVRGKLGCWTWSLDKFNLQKDEIVITGKPNSYSVKKRVFVNKDDVVFQNGKHQFVVSTNTNSRSILDFSTNDGTNTLNLLFEDRGIFNNPKNLEMIKYLLDLLSTKNFVILDFFSGSSTTAHAVMQINADDGGDRKFIMVQLPEECGKASPAYSAGYKNICEIGKERIRRAGEKIKAEHPEAKDLDIGFRVLKVDSSNMNDVYYAPDDYSQGLLDHFESNIKEDRSSLDLLFGCLLDWGLPLSLPYASEKIDGFTVHNYNDGDLIACFDENISDAVIKEIAKRQPLRAVFRDSSFESNPSKINVSEIFKMISPDTTVKVI